MEIADNNKHIEHEMHRGFSWDRAFLTSDGFLGTEELSSMIEGDELQKIEELENMEAKLFQEIKASTKKSTRTSNVANSSISSSPKKRDSQAKKVTGSGGPHKDEPPIKTPPRKSMTSKTDNSNNNAKSPSKTLPAIRTKNKMASVNNNTRVSRTSPASPVSPGSPGSSSSTFGFSQRSKSSGSAPRRTSVNNEKPLVARRNGDQKASKPAVSLMPKTQSKPSPSSSSTAQSSSCTVDQRSKSKNIKSSTVHHISKPVLKNHPTGLASDRNRKQPAKTTATANTGLKPNSPKATTPKKQSSPKANASSENIFIISPELLDLQNKIKALKMEIDMHKKDIYNKMAHVERVEVT